MTINIILTMAKQKTAHAYELELRKMKIKFHR